MNSHYSTSAGGQQNVSDVNNLMNTAVFNPKSKTIAEHIEDMLTLANEVTLAHGAPLADGLILEYILSSMERSECTDYAEDLKDIRRRDVDLVEARRLFQKTESKKLVTELVDKQQRANKRASQTALSADVESPSKRSKKENELIKAAAMIVQNGSSPKKNPFSAHTCSKCGKVGHGEDKCW